MIGVVDYGVGNIQAFLTLLNRIGFDARRIITPEQYEDVTHVILPGVGHFDHAMKCFNDSGLRPIVENHVIDNKKPLLGVCVGMQMLAGSSEEGSLPGLNWVPGRVRAFSGNSRTRDLQLPHMGWNSLRYKKGAKLFSKGFEEEPEFYFLHSYYFDADDKEDVVATALYGVDFDAVVSRGHIHGVQFHPEKCHHWGVQLLKNFLEE